LGIRRKPAPRIGDQQQAKTKPPRCVWGVLTRPGGGAPAAAARRSSTTGARLGGAVSSGSPNWAVRNPMGRTPPTGSCAALGGECWACWVERARWPAVRVLAAASRTSSAEPSSPLHLPLSSKQCTGTKRVLNSTPAGARERFYYAPERTHEPARYYRAY
jgi:hypothetical protein